MVYYIKYDNKEDRVMCIPESERLDVPNKIYGNIEQIAIRVWNDYIYNNRSTGILLTGHQGTGKAQPLNSNIRVRDGWKRMGDIKIGDEVLTIDGSYTKVVNVYPRGKLPIYKITFVDGRSCLASGDHLWSVYNYRWRRGKINGKTRTNIYSGWRVLTTDILREYISKDRFKSNKIKVPLIDPEQSSEKEYIIDPYLLGCFLGDGSTMSGTVELNISDLGVIKRIQSKLLEDYELYYYKDSRGDCYRCRIRIKKEKQIINNIYTSELKRLGLWKVKSYEKFIPEIYLNGSIEQRWELLRGLMDTDGSVTDPLKQSGRTGKPSKSGTILYVTSSIKLCANVKTLIRSLGGIAKSSIAKPFYSYNGERLQGLDSYRVNIRLKTPSLCVTRKSRLKRLKEKNQYSDTLGLGIKSIVPCGVSECRCIQVEHPSRLYVTENYILTHNTYVATLLGNVAIDNKLPVYMLYGKYPEESITQIITFMSRLRNCVIFMDEFGKMIDTRTQNLFLTMLSDLNDTKKIFVLTENNRYEISKYILDRPGRIKYFLEFTKIPESTLLDYLKDFDIKEDFYNDILKLYSKVNEFSFDHIKAIVNEHLKYPNESLTDIINIINAPSLRKQSFLEIVTVMKKPDNKECQIVSGTTIYKKNTINYHDYSRLEIKDPDEEGKINYIILDFYTYNVIFNKSGGVYNDDKYTVIFKEVEK